MEQTIVLSVTMKPCFLGLPAVSLLYFSISEIIKKVQTVCIQIRTEFRSVVIWVQIVCKEYIADDKSDC